MCGGTISLVLGASVLGGWWGELGSAVSCLSCLSHPSLLLLLTRPCLKVSRFITRSVVFSCFITFLQPEASGHLCARVHKRQREGEQPSPLLLHFLSLLGGRDVCSLSPHGT